jgi:hypothetical protein
MAGLRPLNDKSASLERDVCDLRIQGLTYAEIAQGLNLSGKAQAYRICQRALRRVPADSVTELRQIEGQRLDRITAILWPQVLGGSLNAIQTLLRVMERRARLFALDADDGADCSPVSGDFQNDWPSLLIERSAFFEDLVDQGVIAIPEHLQLEKGES